MDSIRQDVCFAYRTLRRNPGFAAVAILIFGLGVGVATAIFAVVNAVLLKPLPYADPSRLVAVTSVFRPETANRIVDTVALRDIQAWREDSRLIESMSGFFFTRTPIRVEGVAYLPDTALVDPALLTTLGVRPAIGTDFEGGGEAGETVIISHAFWQRAFGGRLDVIGQPIHVGPSVLTVRGVLPADFEVPRTDVQLYHGPVDLFAPAVQDPGPSGNRVFWGVARLKPGVGIAQAEAELRSIDAELGGEADDWSVRLSSLTDERTRAARQPLMMFLALGIVLLLIACTNLVNLLVSRNTARAQEMTVRHAAGATGGRLLRQMLTESVCLAAAGGAAGLLFSAAAIFLIDGMWPLRMPVIGGVTFDLTVLGFGVAVAVVSALAVGLIPALGAVARAGSAPGRAQSGATARAFPRTQKGLTVVQIGLCVALLAAAAVLAHSLYRLNTVDRGFDSEHVLGFELTNAGLPQGWELFVNRALEQISAIPGVSRAGYITFLPPETWSGFFVRFHFDGAATEGVAGPVMSANTVMTSPDYFETVGMSMVKGRRFDASDVASAPPVMIVNEAFVNRYSPNEDPLGRRVFSYFDEYVHTGIGSREIVGVVGDTRDRGMDKPPGPTIFLPYRQGMLPYGAIALRSALTPSTLIPEVRRRLRAISPDVPLVAFQSLDERIHDSLRGPRFYALLAGLCAAMAMLFVSVGLYGVISYSVSRRTAEFGVRMALGSSPGRILRLVVRQGAFMALVGAALGVVLALISTRGLESLLFDVDAVDPPTLVASVLLVVGIAFVATCVPARRACKSSPMKALRYE